MSLCLPPGPLWAALRNPRAIFDAPWALRPPFLQASGCFQAWYSGTTFVLIARIRLISLLFQSSLRKPKGNSRPLIALMLPAVA